MTEQEQFFQAHMEKAEHDRPDCPVIVGRSPDGEIVSLARRLPNGKAERIVDTRDFSLNWREYFKFQEGKGQQAQQLEQEIQTLKQQPLLAAEGVRIDHYHAGLTPAVVQTMITSILEKLPALIGTRGGAGALPSAGDRFVFDDAPVLPALKGVLDVNFEGGSLGDEYEEEGD